MKTVITNTAALNTGDAAILSATIDILGRAFDRNVEFAVYDQQAAAADRYYRDISFRPILFEQVLRWTGRRRFKAGVALLLAVAAMWPSPLRPVLGRLLPPALRSSLDDMAGADFVLAAGGTYLVPHYRTFPKVLDLLVAYALKRPVILFTQSLGPFQRRKDRLLRFVLRRARLILVRDPRSRRHLEQLGVSSDRIAECADAAFAFAPLSLSASGRAAENRPLRVAISVRDWPHIRVNAATGMSRYLDAVADGVRWLVEERGASVRFLSTCQGVTEYWTDDSRTADAVVERLSESVRPHVSIDRAFHSPEALVSLLREFDVVVATRMHMAILALCAGVPVLPIAYEFKTNELFDRLGLGGFVQEIESVTGDSLRHALERLLRARPEIEKALPGRVARERDSAFAAGQLVRRALEATP